MYRSRQKKIRKKGELGKRCAGAVRKRAWKAEGQEKRGRKGTSVEKKKERDSGGKLEQDGTERKGKKSSKLVCSAQQPAGGTKGE